MSSRIEQIIEEIEEYVESCKYQPLSTTKIIVNKEEIEELLRELRLKTPDEIKRYQKIISNKDAILQDAQAKADKIIEDTKLQVQEMVKESEVMQQAYAQANEVVMIATKQAQDILDNATNEANSIRMSAMAYTDEKLGAIEGILVNSIDTTKARSENLVSSLQGFLDIVAANRAELRPQQPASPQKEEKEEKTEEEASEEVVAIDYSNVVIDKETVDKE